MSGKGQATSRKARFSAEDLKRKIRVGGKTLTISNATAEEFDIFVFGILEQMYKKQYFLLRTYNETFNYDWTEPRLRIVALNGLHRLNLARRSATPPKPKIPLFAEEEEQVYA